MVQPPAMLILGDNGVLSGTDGEDLWVLDWYDEPSCVLFACVVCCTLITDDGFLSRVASPDAAHMECVEVRRRA